ncbi:MAG: radical SAM protein, partial [Gammaproteobacteria bacterium]|nr:radical SAM protein [Gammaproteobacteria bacterium]
MQRATGDADLRSPGAVLLVSTYELGHQPHGITLPKAFLERAGFEPSTMDLAVDEFDAAKVERARFVAVSVPMHTALRLGEGVARRIRRLNPDAAICFHGHYALLHGAALREELADFVLGGELEEQLVKILEGQSDGGDAAALSRLEIPVPSRDGLPRADRYAHLVHGEKHVAAGYTEATRGCSHLCGHCPIPAVYDGKLFVVPEHVVLDDIRQQVRAGVGHIT